MALQNSRKSTISTQQLPNAETQRMLSTRSAAVLMDKLKEFRQSYNRTHGQVCEFFEQAQIIEKLYCHVPGPSKTTIRRERSIEDEENDEDCGNEQKTWSIKQKLNAWRAVMREVVNDVCPSIQLENQPEINPGLMKHVLDEIRKLKTELAFQHNTILELTHQLESHQTKNQRKDRVIEKLLSRSQEIRLEKADQWREEGGDHYDPLLSFGSLDDLNLDLDDLFPHSLEEVVGGGSSGVPCVVDKPVSNSAELNSTTDLRSHILDDKIDLTVSTQEGKALNGMSPNSDGHRNLDRFSNSSRLRWRNRTVLDICGSICFGAYVSCGVLRVLRRGARNNRG